MMMTVKQVAEALEVSERSVWRWSATGVLPPGVKIGSVVRWPEESIRRWIEEKEREARARAQAPVLEQQNGPSA